MKRLLTAIILVMSWVSAAQASLLTQVGQFAASTVGATTTVTTSFQGKAIIFWTAGKTSGTESALASWSKGFADNNGNMVSDSWAAADNVSTTSTGQSVVSTAALRIFTAAPNTTGTGGQITGVTFNSGNFVVTFNATPASAWLINYILIGGSDITNTFVGQFSSPAGGTTGVQHITTPGFQGTMLFTLGNMQATLGTGPHSSTMFGAAVSATKRWAFTGMEQNAVTSVATTAAKHFLAAAKVFQLMYIDNGQIFSADFSAWTSTGFDYNITTGSSSNFEFGYLDIQGGQWDVGTGTKPTTATTQTVTGESFQPSFLSLFTSSPTTTSTGTANEISSFGATDGTNQVSANATNNNVIPTVAKSSSSATTVLLDRDGTNNPVASFTSFNSDGWTITWNATGTAKEVGWITAASSPVGGATGVPVIY